LGKMVGALGRSVRRGRCCWSFGSEAWRGKRADESADPRSDFGVDPDESAIGDRVVALVEPGDVRLRFADRGHVRVAPLRGEAVAGGDRLTSMRWCRTSCLQARRCSLRLQSRVAAAVRDPPGVDATAHSRGLRLGGRAPIPLTLLAQRTRAAVANAGRIHHAQTSIDLATPLLGTKLLASRTAERPIWLKGKVLS